ncbi:MAG: hypothetical protein FJY97_08480 [candidate division Zixibacteria bacterium]|nr:hypothetical protein [candidate division Zixibacteria bacterium]
MYFKTPVFLLVLLTGAPIYAQTTDSTSLSVVADDTGGATRKSKTKAALLSLLVPGLGQTYAGASGRARIFFVTEGVTWAGFTMLRTYGGWRADDYRVYAADHAGVTLAGQDDTFFRNIGAFSSNEVFNFQQQLIQGSRARLYTGTHTWAWDAETSRKAYLDIRQSSRRADTRSVYLIGFALVTRIVSAIDAVRGIDTRGASTSSFHLFFPPNGAVWLTAGVAF